MLIFDRFESTEEAQRFAAHVLATFGRTSSVHGTQDESDQVDPFPFVLTPPVVLVERTVDYEPEEAILCSVGSFGGRFAGT